MILYMLIMINLFLTIPLIALHFLKIPGWQKWCIGFNFFAAMIVFFLMLNGYAFRSLARYRELSNLQLLTQAMQEKRGAEAVEIVESYMNAEHTHPKHLNNNLLGLLNQPAD